MDLVCQASLYFTISQNLLKLMSIVLVIPCSHLVLCHPLLLPSVFPSFRVFSNESALHIRSPKYWSFSFNIGPSKDYSGLISFRTDWWISLQSKGLKSVNALNFNLCCQISFQKDFVLRPVKWPYPLRTYYQSLKFCWSYISLLN